MAQAVSFHRRSGSLLFFVVFASSLPAFVLSKRLQCSETTVRRGAARIVHLGWSIYSSGLNLLAYFRSLRGSVVRNPRNLSGFNFFFSDRLDFEVSLPARFCLCLYFIRVDCDSYLGLLTFGVECVVLTRLNAIIRC